MLCCFEIPVGVQGTKRQRCCARQGTGLTQCTRDRPRFDTQTR